jgi:hypothetical protein
MADRTEFNLSQHLASWRRSMMENERLRIEDAEELEGHLRDSMGSLRARGLSEEEAFVVAARRLGDGVVLGGEYSKVHGGTVWVRRLFWMLVGVVALRICSSLSTSVGWLAVAVAGTWINQATTLGVLGITVRIGALALSLVGVGVLLWEVDRRSPDWMRRHPWWLATGLGFLALAAAAASPLGSIVLASTTGVEMLGRIMRTTSYASMGLSAAMTFALGFGIGFLAWLIQRQRAMTK